MENEILSLLDYLNEAVEKDYRFCKVDGMRLRIPLFEFVIQLKYFEHLHQRERIEIAISTHWDMNYICGVLSITSPTPEDDSSFFSHMVKKVSALRKRILYLQNTSASFETVGGFTSTLKDILDKAERRPLISNT